ncbi:hypothetical protein GOBAR_AA17605 [Gossypium barbadense]|uniref:Disease resistance protein winged helix domain-containing protein n=1 Tax=Gossypium barbadense TaxID=3634 RepID=A0A2P5XI61_GOSBA|nr:hypothetical protein GOBAR_AA17605 [Gossypium barbadense]
MTGFQKDEVVHLWIAEGFIHQPKGMKKVEDLGSEYFHELLSQSFFQQSSVSKSCYMTHDIINDLAQYVDEELYFRLGDKVNSNEQYNVSERARHSSFIRQKYDVLRKFEPFYKTKCLRTFLSFTCLCARSGKMPLPVGNLINLKKLSKFIVAKGNGPRITELKGLSHLQGSLEFISIRNCKKLKGLPHCLSTFEHLTELHVNQCSSFEYFPESGLPIHNLRTLLIFHCENLKSLLNRMHDLTTLQHLTVFGCPCIETFPEGGFPPNLLSLTILGCKQLELRFAMWHLHKPTSLEDLIVEGLLDLISRKALDVWNCPNLQCLPEKGLPITLDVLQIRNCPLLEEECRNEKGHIKPLALSHRNLLVRTSSLSTSDAELRRSLTHHYCYEVAIHAMANTNHKAANSSEIVSSSNVRAP